ncbi:UNVERIFIED_CONTAM: hypothetical protein GTU68_008696 [Idotea baltica]|nr:hypothetical protein [Idotea baltica]
MKRTKIKALLASQETGKQVCVKGWIRSFRNNQFIAINDGSTVNTIQAVAALDKFDDETRKKLNVGAAVGIIGELVESQGKGQSVEIVASEIIVYGEADPEKYPLQPKKHSMEFLREISHLRFRTNTFGAIFRIRHAAAFAIHQFFNDKGFVYLHSPIITGSDAEGAGEMFRVSTYYKKDFFGKETNLTVSGQLEAELGALAFSDVYTFGPTFRAENSNTSRHLAEFWMIEPEIAFAGLQENMDLAEEMLKYIVKYALEHCEEKLKPMAERSPMPLREKLEFCIDNDFVRLTYTEAINILKNSKPNKKKKFKFPIDEWGADLQSEHERYLVEKHFKKPVILTDYPASIKAFYMRLNEDEKTVAAMDILFPGIGEIVGGSVREERYEVLKGKMEAMDIPPEEMSWYLDTRRFGTCPHAGYGLGFARMILFLTGMGNIRDVIPFPRTPGNAGF